MASYTSIFHDGKRAVIAGSDIGQGCWPMYKALQPFQMRVSGRKDMPSSGKCTCWSCMYCGSRNRPVLDLLIDFGAAGPDGLQASKMSRSEYVQGDRRLCQVLAMSTPRFSQIGQMTDYSVIRTLAKT